jgi:hypothetical protein
MFLRSMTHITRGLGTLAILYALPYVLLIWSYVASKALSLLYARSFLVPQVAFFSCRFLVHVFLFVQLNYTHSSGRVPCHSRRDSPIVYPNGMDPRTCAAHAISVA